MTYHELENELALAKIDIKTKEIQLKSCHKFCDKVFDWFNDRYPDEMGKLIDDDSV